jgi:hypothetical protein
MSVSRGIWNAVPLGVEPHLLLPILAARCTSLRAAVMLAAGLIEVPCLSTIR